MRITRIYADPNGESHFEDLGDLEFEDLTHISFTSKIQGEIGKLTKEIRLTSMRIHQYDMNLYEDWHHPPLGKTYVIFLEGAQEIEISDGTKRIFSYGDMLLLDDLTGIGHRVRAVKAGKSIILI